MIRDTLDIGEVRANNLKSINILLGRNGAGKSRFLRAIDQYFMGNSEFNVRYISPERAGVFKRDGNIMTNMESDPNWIGYARRMNQAANFKAASANLLREVETAYLRKLQDNPEIRLNQTKNFRTERLDSINRLLSNLEICQEGSNFVFRNINGEEVQPDQISSGESESVSLAVEMMYFFDNLKEEKFNLLLLDEPDVHLHPDLQARLATFLINLVEGLNEVRRKNVAVILATHSTPLICSLSQSEYTSIGTKEFNSNNVSFVEISNQLKKIAPFFGHPLSLSLSQDVMLILEGEDDERVWQQASRSSQGRLKIFPVIASSVNQQTELEKFTADLIDSLYDEPKAFSLRDGDGVSGPLTNIKSVIRYRLQCYAIENLLLSDQCLSVLGKTWEEFKYTATSWLKENEKHKDSEKIQELIVSPTRLVNTKIKTIRQLICAICGSGKPWEVVVGQSIGSLDISNLPDGDFDLPKLIGRDATLALLGE
ncbi:MULTISPECIES: AAA family ATPase [Aeromonas]|uniref:AAA family ATPase n=1 Tax=Aeromonas TaxID=642 RepID=UPI001C24EBBE|nr:MULTISPECIES: AAA family ATPase [Aeromonas]MCR3937230.1 ATP-binding protein [Aeromonas caviae]MCR3945643.1 ATP-binding protein [Aeromonas caviae]QWZ56201.1 ATP-binding protein [Aeromonas sp. FDAARGOS 1402]